MKLGVNVGSGQRPFHSVIGEEMVWVNIDCVAREGMPRPDLICDASNLKPYVGDSTVDYVVLHHVLEHFGCGEGVGLIREAHRVLKKEGRLLVFVPDLRKLAGLYLNGELSTQLYATNLYGAYMGNEADRHKWGFDQDHLLNFLMMSARWEHIMAFDWRTIPGADIAHDDRWILGMEAIK